jgi:general secretion pathway protein F
MARYTYIAYDAAGARLTGTLEADTREGALASLNRQGYLPLELKEGGSNAASDGLPWWKRDLFGGGGLSHRNLSLITRELATLLEADLPIDETLRIVALQPLMGARARQILKSVLDAVMGGASFSEALAMQKGVFPEYYWRIVQSGEAAGSLARALNELATFLERQGEFRARIGSALLYPSILLVAAGLALIVILTVLVPTIAPLFKDAGAAPPLLIQLMIDVQEGAFAHWPLVLTCLVALVVGGFVLMRRPETRLARDRFLLRLPLVAALVQNEQTATFSRTLGTLLHNNVPVLQALNVASNVLTNQVMANAVATAAQTMKEGATLTAPLAQSGVFPELAIRLYKVGEQTGDLSIMLGRVANIYETAVSRQLLRLTSILTPVLTLLFGGLVGGLLVSVMGAIVGLNDLALR